MDYPAAIQFLYDLQKFGANLGLKNPRRLAALVGNPQERLRFIHVAGTNGKGSTCAMLESIYRAAGLRVGLFTSPHLVSFRERIQVNRAPIAAIDVARLVGEMQPFLRQFSLNDEPTFFEVVTVLALRHFDEQRCDLVILETGLGGRLDATNIVTPIASVITNVALEHQEWLGDTLEKIAAEKAGIIKSGVPVITTAAELEVLRVIEETAARLGSPLTKVNPSSAPIEVQMPFALPLLGEHQQINATLAAATIRTLQEKIPVSDDVIRRGLETVSWPGRLQVVKLQDGRTLLLDGAHNLAGVEALRAALARYFQNERPTFVIGMLADKDWSAMARLLAPLAARIITVPVSSARTVATAESAAVCRESNPVVETADSLNEVLQQTQNDRFIVVTGSLYLIGEALELLGLLPSDGGERGLNEWKTNK